MSNPKSLLSVATTFAIASSFVFSASITQASAQSHRQEGAQKARPHIDLAFCIDTTGSMQGEINNVKSKTKEIVAKLAGAKPTPEIRVGLVAYRDRGDEYVTKVFPFTADIDHIVHDINSLKADGGGDTPEAVNQGLHAAVSDLQWSDDKHTLKMLFLIGDAGPHAYPSDYDWHTEAKNAIGKGIQINTLGCHGLESANGVDVFQQIAKLADGNYESLSYRTEIANADGKKETVIASGGAVYRFKGKGAEWKNSISSLKARRELADIPSQPMAMAASAPTVVTGSLMRATIPTMSAGRLGDAAAEKSVALNSRDDNNLADVVLSATKAAAVKKLGVNFSAK